MKGFNAFNISELRTALMGVGCALILLCHAVGNNVKMNNYFVKIADNGQIGVDIFLFLSGLGLAFSLKHSATDNNIAWLKQWYKKRLYRIFFPYLLLTIPYLSYKILFEDLSLARGLIKLSTIDYWIWGDGAWFISLILILYIFAPLINWCFQNRYKWIMAVGLSLLLMFLCNESVNGPFKYASIAFRRVPSFIIGIAIAKNVMERKEFKILNILLLCLIPFFLVTFLFPSVYCRWLIILPLNILLCLAISNLKWLSYPLCFLGAISLETYLTNIYLGDILNHKSWLFGSIDLSYGHYLEYSTVLFVGVVLAYYTNYCVKKIIQ